MCRRIRSFIINVALLPLYWISLFTTRKKNLWVFGSFFGRSYTDNSKWLFESVCRNEHEIRAIWLTRDKNVAKELRCRGFEVYLVNSWRGYWITCQASLAVVSWGIADLNRVAISKAKKLQLWHGSPMKKINLDDIHAHGEFSPLLKTLKKFWTSFFPFMDATYDVAIACSEIFKGYMESAFGLESYQVKITGYPRNDVLLEPSPPTISYIENLKKSLLTKKFLLYAPTFRNSKKDMVKLFSTFDMDKFECFLANHDAILFIKMHYVYLGSLQLINTEEKTSRIRWLDQNVVPEINPLLNYVDILMTDYSGVYFDYLLLDRPVIFTPFDLDDYLAFDRAMYDDYENFTIAGPKCKNWNEVMEECERILNGNDRYADQRKFAQKKYNSFVDEKSCSRVIEVAKHMAGLD